MWTANGCDFDLWVKPSENTRELYYGNNTTSEGKYFRDFRNRNDQRDYEYVELKQSVDLRQARVWVNFYSGKTPSPAGIVIVHYRGKTYQSAFFLKASKGNHGKDSHLRSQSSYWTEINISQIVGLSP
jgi:hypothetical protein